MKTAIVVVRIDTGMSESFYETRDYMLRCFNKSKVLEVVKKYKNPAGAVSYLCKVHAEKMLILLNDMYNSGEFELSQFTTVKEANIYVINDGSLECKFSAEV